MADFKLKRNGAGGISGPLLLVVLDGFGIYKGAKDGYPGNAIDLADAPFIKELLSGDAPTVSTQLKAHGKAMGLPSDGDMGNSEVGHNAMGAGRVFAQGAKLVNDAIQSGKLFQGACWKKLIGSKDEPGIALERKRPVHFIGLLSDGGVHSHISQLLALIDKCAAEGVERVYIHTLLDGRDVEKASALAYIDILEDKLRSYDVSGQKYSIASGGGRQIITMDRYEADWNMVLLGWKTHVGGEGRMFSSARDAIETYRKESVAKGVKLIDQDIPPFVIAADDGKAIAPIETDDCVIFFNYRGDRAIEISRAFTEDDCLFPFPRIPAVEVHYAGMMEYDGDLHIPRNYLVEPPEIDRTVSEYLALNSIPQFAIAETQKFGHITYFWNGNNSGKFSEKYETWMEIPSDKVPFDQAPRMKADEITDALCNALNGGEYKFLRVNYANGDMVGHTGNLQAAVEAVEALDQNLSRLFETVQTVGATMVITADHGNCDQMYEIDKELLSIKHSVGGSIMVKTSHTLSPVPFILVGINADKFVLNSQVETPGLGNLAATLLTILGYEPPEDYLPPVVVFKD